MHKRTFLICLSIVIATVITSCIAIKNLATREIINSQTSQENTAKEIINPSIPGFGKTYKEIAQIDVIFDTNGVYWGESKLVHIKDNKIISDILAMVEHSDVLTNESKTKNMSGMATKNNKLILYEQSGNRQEITFAYDDPAFALGYLNIDGKKYEPGFSFFRYMRDLTEYRQFNTNIESQVSKLFKKYNWTVDYRINTIKETLPSNLKHEAGEYPIKIYWAYNNELSKNIGLDYSSYLGKIVDIDIYRLREQLPDFMKPRMNARGIVLKYNGKIIGSFIDAGRHICFACSLDRKSLKDTTKKEWDNWVSDYIDYNNELEIKLSKMSPEDVIKHYYNAMNNHDEKMQFACMTRRNICSYLSANMDNNRLYNEGFKSAYADGEQNVKSAKLIKLRKIEGMENPSGTIRYVATVDFNFKKVITSNSGVQPRFLLLKKESKKSGWRIQGEGTGP